MKLNTRTLGILAALTVVGVANAANPYSFSFAYGDSATAALNGKAVGDAVDNTGPIKIGLTGGFKFQLLAHFTGQGKAGAGGLFVGLDDSVDSVGGSGTNDYAWLQAHGVAGAPLSASYINTAVGLPGVDNAGGAVNVDLQWQPSGGKNTYYTGLFGSASVGHRIGLAGAVIFGTGLSLNPVAGATYRLADVEFGSSLTAGKTHVVSLDTMLNATSRSNFFTVGGARPTSTEHELYTVQAVPEPTTMLAIGAGLAALAARKRRKS